MKGDPDGKQQVDAYLRALPPAQRRTLAFVRKAMLSVSKKAEEKISYGIPCVIIDGAGIGYGPAKKHCSIYAMNPSVQKQFAEELTGYDMGPGTIRFPIGKPPPAILIKRLMKARVAQHKERVAARGK